MSLEGQPNLEQNYSSPNALPTQNIPQLNAFVNPNVTPHGHLNQYSRPHSQNFAKLPEQPVSNIGAPKVASEKNSDQYNHLGSPNVLQYSASNLHQTYPRPQIPPQTQPFLSQPTPQMVGPEYHSTQLPTPAYTTGHNIPPQNMMPPMYPQRLPGKNAAPPAMQGHIPSQQPRRLDPDQMPNPIQVKNNDYKNN